MTGHYSIFGVMGLEKGVETTFFFQATLTGGNSQQNKNQLNNNIGAG